MFLQLKKNKISSLVYVLLLSFGFGLSVLLRLLIGGAGAARSPWAGIVFAFCLISIGYMAKTNLRLSKKSLVIGIVGAAVLLIPPLTHRLFSGNSHTPQGNYIIWASVVVLVAFAEEYFLRGTLYEAAQKWRGDWVAILIGAIAFAALHIPLYGLHIIPLDFIVGMWLGVLRYISRTPFAPGVTHVVADLLGWWLR
jgi:membrane protease YdiL (CAAX protease family)